MKIRIYAILPDTDENTIDAISSEIKIKDDNPITLGRLVSQAAELFPDWRELNIERLTD